jgi:cell division protein FtsW (lipid II flippase)
MSKKLGYSSVAFTTWLMVIIAFMLLIRTFDLDIFFALALIGLIVIVVLIDTSSVQPKYLRRMNYMVAACLVIFSYIVANRIVGFLTP